MKTFLTLALALLSVGPAFARDSHVEARHHRSGHGPTRVHISAGAWHGHRHGGGFYGYSPYRYSVRSYPRYYGYYAAPVVSYGYASSYYSPVYSDYSYSRPSYAGSGLFWGALAGAIVGNNSSVFGHNGLRGAAIGAGAGLLIGSVAESNARQREAAAERAPRTETSQTSEAVTSQPMPSTPAPKITAPASTSPMASANTLFGR